jgi:hypothetical protein
MTTTTITLDVCTPEGKTWLAAITGLDAKFGLQRSFVVATDRNLSGSGKTGSMTYAVTDGIYESSEGRKRLGRRFWRVEGDQVSEIQHAEVLDTLGRAS